MKKENAQVLKLKISIVGSEPSIWRSILIPANTSFYNLHTATQAVFGWENAHMHHFLTTNPFKRNRDYKRIGDPMPGMMMAEDDELINEDEELLSKWLNGTKATLWYEYDFGDSWMHKIILEQLQERDPYAKYPQLLDGAMACPPEDCGGLSGYARLCEILANPTHTEHADTLDWMGLENLNEFDPSHFDSNKIAFQDMLEK